jgi:hypothetical protein
MSGETHMSAVIKQMLKKCASTLNDDLEALSPRDRIMLWKEYGRYFEDSGLWDTDRGEGYFDDVSGSGSGSASGLWDTDRGNGGIDSDVPGMNIRSINVNIVTNGGAGDEIA